MSTRLKKAAPVLVQTDPTGVPEPADFEVLHPARMAQLGAKGGKVSRGKRMAMPVKKRRKIASLGAKARWAKTAKRSRNR